MRPNGALIICVIIQFGWNRRALVSLSSKNLKPTASRRTWEAEVPFLHCLEGFASLAPAPAVSWDILGWGTLPAPWDLPSMLNNISEQSIRSITYLNSSSALISSLFQLQLLVPFTNGLWEQGDNKSKSKFCPKKIPFKQEVLLSMLGQAALPLTQDKKAWEPAVMINMMDLIAFSFCTQLG